MILNFSATSRIGLHVRRVGIGLEESTLSTGGMKRSRIIPERLSNPSREQNDLRRITATVTEQCLLKKPSHNMEVLR